MSIKEKYKTHNKRNFDPVDVMGMAANLNHSKLKSNIDVHNADRDFLFGNDPDDDNITEIDIKGLQDLLSELDTNSITDHTFDNKSNNALNDFMGNDSEGSIDTNLSSEKSFKSSGSMNKSLRNPTKNFFMNPMDDPMALSNALKTKKNTSNFRQEAHKYKYKDEQRQAIEYAHEKRKHVNDVMNSFNEEDQSDFIELEKKAEEDNKYIWLDEIDLLKESIKGYGVKLEHIPEVDVHNTPEDIYNVYQLLLYKYNSVSNWGMVEEMIEMGADAVEWLFDGKRDIFGSRPNADGFKRNTKLKLRKLRYKSAKSISNTVSKSSSSLATVLAWDLIPSLLFQIRTNSKKQDDIEDIQEGLSTIGTFR